MIRPRAVAAPFKHLWSYLWPPSAHVWGGALLYVQSLCLFVAHKDQPQWPLRLHIGLSPVSSVMNFLMV